MIGALLPLPPDPNLSVRERDRGSSNLADIDEAPTDYAREFGPVDEARFESARWWRGLNRWMSFVGVMIIAVVVSASVCARDKAS